ncbi:unnamed protein product [Caenorhabditis auriculariae]|uniref:Uncharacterized protein n=1 Tax=Caenorhabditis auriculariae TaxID=2777116 RepID=A0A8S1HMZ4_9PELO|nr:unnamed protein product [Caenorhabditis auriculariae]
MTLPATKSGRTWGLVKNSGRRQRLARVRLASRLPISRGAQLLPFSKCSFCRSKNYRKMSASSLETSSKNGYRGLNMEHGFIKHIVKNQISRDEYHKVNEEKVKNRQEKFREEGRVKDRKSNPTVGTPYVPPHLRNSWSGSRSSSSASAERNVYVPPHLRSPVTSSKTDFVADESTEEESKESSFVKKSPILTESEEIKLRSKVRSREMSRMMGMDELTVSLKNASLSDTNSAQDFVVFQLGLKVGDTTVSIEVKKSDSAARLSKALSREHDFTDAQCRSLRIFIDQQMAQRLEKARKRAQEMEEKKDQVFEPEKAPESSDDPKSS